MRNSKKLLETAGLEKLKVRPRISGYSSLAVIVYTHQIRFCVFYTRLNA